MTTDRCICFVSFAIGFRAEGAHLPTPPPIPEAIAKSLQYIRSVQPQQIGFNQNQFNQNQQNSYNKFGWAKRTFCRWKIEWVVCVLAFFRWHSTHSYGLKTFERFQAYFLMRTFAYIRFFRNVFLPSLCLSLGVAHKSISNIYFRANAVRNRHSFTMHRQTVRWHSVHHSSFGSHQMST